MRRISGLDALITRFRERWETDSRYRAAMSGVIGLVVVIGMCACMATASVIANNALAGGGFTTGTGGQQTGGGGVVQAAPSFPTPTVPSWQVAATPAWAAIPNSQTPVPTPTPYPTAIPTNTPVPNSGLNVSFDPSPWTSCSGGSNCDSLAINQGPPNTSVQITIIYPSTPPTTIGPTTITTDANGDYTYSFAGTPCNGKAVITLQIGSQISTFKHSCNG